MSMQVAIHQQTLQSVGALLPEEDRRSLPAAAR
jgi:hypothetical protein